MNNDIPKVFPRSEMREPTRWGLRQRELRTLAMVICIKALMFLFGIQSYQVLQNQRVAGLRGWLEIWNRWDALNYQKLAQFGYGATGELRPLLVFYPLFPWSVRLFGFITRDYLISAFIVSTIASLVTAIVLLRLVELDYSRALAQRAVWFLFIFPTSYFLHIGYTESLFLMLALSSVYAARKQRWLLAAVFGALTCLTRPNGVLLLPVLIVEAAHQYRTSRRWRWQMLYIALAAVGFGGYLLLNKYVTGDAFAFTSLQQQFFGKSLSSPLTGIDNALGSMTRAPSEAEMVGTQEVLFITLGLICTIVSWIKLRPAYSVWMTGNWLLFVSVSFVLSIPRYTLTMFPIFILFAMLAARPIWLAVITAWSILYLSFFASTFVSGHWAF
ncbi:MAG TPA: glycosyltransferase family 39 protein [Pyrinomonadaceae bacterium]|nr:glycosyltransferase family 39 protein [Pyrinomonadaceae bacterium]